MNVLQVWLCYVSVVVGPDAELDESSVDNVSQSEDKIVSQGRELSVGEKSDLQDRVDEILRPLGFETRLLVLDRTKSIAVFFVCMTLIALTRLRDQWSSGQLKGIVESLFTFISDAKRPVRVKRLTWSLTDYERCLKFFSSLQGRKPQCIA